MIFGIVEGEPGIFPDPIARLLRALTRPLRRERPSGADAERDEDAPAPPDDHRS